MRSALAALERGDQVVAAARTITPQTFDDRYADRGTSAGSTSW
ncbi:hypothetical protein ACGF0J_08835 [Nonomuraea sp. NPDC047897]